jgi:hypothetical protein
MPRREGAPQSAALSMREARRLGRRCVGGEWEMMLGLMIDREGWAVLCVHRGTLVVHD